MSEQTQVYVLNYPPAYSRSPSAFRMCWWSGNLEKKEKEKEEKGEKKRIQLALHLEIYIQPFRNILTPFRKLVISKYYYLSRIDLLDEIVRYVCC